MPLGPEDSAREQIDRMLEQAGWACLLVVRTVLEDRTLLRDLPGYSDYAGRVRFRLVPGIW